MNLQGLPSNTPQQCLLEAEMRRRTVPNEARAFRPLARRGALGREGWLLGYPSGPSIQKWAVSWDRPSWEIQCPGHELRDNWMDFCVTSIWNSLFSDILASPAARWRKVRSTRTSFTKLSGLAVSHGVPPTTPVRCQGKWSPNWQLSKKRRRGNIVRSGNFILDFQQWSPLTCFLCGWNTWNIVVHCAWFWTCFINEFNVFFNIFHYFSFKFAWEWQNDPHWLSDKSNKIQPLVRWVWGPMVLWYSGNPSRSTIWTQCLLVNSGLWWLVPSIFDSQFSFLRNSHVFACDT